MKFEKTLRSHIAIPLLWHIKIVCDAITECVKHLELTIPLRIPDYLVYVSLVVVVFIYIFSFGKYL